MSVRKSVLLLACGVLFPGCMSMSGAKRADLFVSPNGADTGSGTAAKIRGEAGPFASLERARDEIRRLKSAGLLPADGLVVELAPGTYERDRVFELSAEDSGTAEAPITYRAAAGAEVRLSGGRTVTNFTAVSEPAILARLDAEARGKVYVSDLRELGISDLGSAVSDDNRIELFFADEPMMVARWPNEGFVRIVDLVGGAPHKIHGIPGDKIGRFTYSGDRPERWLAEPEVWLHGYWFWDWADQRQRIEAIDIRNKVISLAPPYHTYGYRRNQWYYAQNVLAELDMPGEWYLDRSGGKLYFWPPAPLADSRAVVSILPGIVTATEVSHVILQGFTFEACRGTAVSIRGGESVQVRGCTVRNTGGSAISASGLRHAVVGCDVYGTGAGGIHLNGGDRTALTPGGLLAENNHVHHYARWKRVYQPGITVHGCGNRVARNLIDNAPHMGMGFGGNNHIIELNEIHSVCYESNDAGAIYTGRDWSQRGTIIRHNYLHHINGFEGRGCVGVYLDDQFSGTEISGNLFYKVTRAAMIGGGRDCRIENNIFVDCVPSVHVDSRGLGWAARGFGGLKGKLEKFPYQSPPWSTQYPALVTILDDDPMAPKGNTIARNICVGGKWGSFDSKSQPLVAFADNLLDVDPRFVDAEHLDFRLRDDSPAWQIGFQRIPVEEIGVYKDSARASWPVVSTVRPMVVREKSPVATRKNPVVFSIRRSGSRPTVDAVIGTDEWPVAEAAATLEVAQGIHGEKISPPSRAWLSWDDEAFYVAVENAVNPKFPILPGNTWGQDDAIELALRNPGAGKNAPIIVLRGFPSGHFESSGEAGAPSAVVARASQGVVYKARQVDDKIWVAECSIPFSSLGLNPAALPELQFNLSVRKTADDQWVEWQGTAGSTWQVENAGIVKFVK